MVTEVSQQNGNIIRTCVSMTCVCEERRGKESSTVQGENRASDYNWRNAYRILVSKPDRRPLGKPRRHWEDYIKMVYWE
jgi:hypothetical protein